MFLKRMLLKLNSLIAFPILIHLFGNILIQFIIIMINYSIVNMGNYAIV
jgi:hypothetical protein